MTMDNENEEEEKKNENEKSANVDNNDDVGRCGTIYEWE